MAVLVQAPEHGEGALLGAIQNETPLGGRTGRQQSAHHVGVRGGREAGNLEGLIRMTDCNLTLAHRLAGRGAQVYPRIVPGGEHCEASWEQQIPVFMSYLWGI